MWYVCHITLCHSKSFTRNRQSKTSQHTYGVSIFAINKPRFIERHYIHVLRFSDTSPIRASSLYYHHLPWNMISITIATLFPLDFPSLTFTASIPAYNGLFTALPLYWGHAIEVIEHMAKGNAFSQSTQNPSIGLQLYCALLWVRKISSIKKTRVKQNRMSAVSKPHPRPTWTAQASA